MFIDTHSHVHFKAFQHDMEDVIRRAIAADVSMITVGTQSTTSKNGVEVAAKHERVWAAVGLHPNHLFRMPIDEAESPFISRAEDFDRGYYENLARQPKVVAIGECGLDWYRIPADANHEEVKAKQEQVFRSHLDLATEANLPVIVHCRDAHIRSAEILGEYVKAGKLARRGVIHCFTATWKEAAPYMDLGFNISFTGVITFEAKGGGRERQLALLDAATKTPLERLMVETDSPYLAPVPHRGERNEPAYVRFVAEKVAEIKGVSFSEVEKQTTENAVRLFGLQ
ncbi:MAG: TatD family hydrolase [Patescibacteria group bacterium]